MIVPAALAGKGPSAKRAIGMLPAVAMLVAIGALVPQIVVRRWLGERAPERTARLQALWTLVLTAGFAGTGWLTYQDYFVVWASNDNLSKHFEADASAIGRYIGELPPEEEVYLSPELPKHPAIRFHSNLRDDVRGYNGRVCFAAPSRTHVPTTYVIVPGTGDRSLDRLEAYFPQGQRVDQRTKEAIQSLVAYRIPAGAEAAIEPTYSVEASWDQLMRFVGYSLNRKTARSGETVSLTLTYRAVAKMDQRYTAFVHLLGPLNPETGNALWAQHDSEPCQGFYPTSSWHEGELLENGVELHIPEDAPPDTYTLATGFYDVWSGERLPVRSDTSVTENDVLTLGPLTVLE